MKPKAKIWLEKDSEPVFGDGRCDLLKAIALKGSISAGAKNLSMSYKQAWDEISLMEERLGVKLLTRRTGGSRGGGAELTKYAVELIGKYERFRERVTSSIEKAFRDGFH